MDPGKSAREHYERGRTLRHTKMYEQALSEFQQATKDPNYAGEAQAQLGFCLRALGRHEEAVTAWRQALDSSSLSEEEYIHVLYLVGQCLESLGRPAEAIESYNWVRWQDPGFLDVESRIKNLCGGAQPSHLAQVVGLVQLGRAFIGKLPKCVAR